MRKISALTPLLLPFVLSLSKHRTSFPALREERTALRQAQGERTISVAWLPAVALVISPLLAGCERPEPEAKGIDASNPLEVAARERGVVRAEAGSPVGVFERRHDLGRDAMCVVPDEAGKWRFAVTASFGTTLSCLATGTMVREGDKWRMRFAGVEDCEALVHEEEDELRLPGRLPPQCAHLCPNRASLSGLRLPRASWSVDDAQDLRIADQSGNIVRPCAG